MASKLITSENTKRAERAVRSAAVDKFGHRRKDVFYEHGQWWVRMTTADDRDVFFSAVDTNRGIDFERV